MNEWMNTYIACIFRYEMEVMVMTDDMELREKCNSGRGGYGGIMRYR